MYNIPPQRRSLIEEAARLEPLSVVARRFKVGRRTLYEWGLRARGYAQPKRIQWSAGEELQIAAWDASISQLEAENDRIRTRFEVAEMQRRH